jgi:iron complex transport system ATP-binding protein
LGNKGRLLNILTQLAEAGVTIVFTTHDPDSAAMIADEIILIKFGQVLDAGRMETVFTSEKLSDVYQTGVTVQKINGRYITILNNGRFEQTQRENE